MSGHGEARVHPAPCLEPAEAFPSNGIDDSRRRRGGSDETECSSASFPTSPPRRCSPAEWDRFGIDQIEVEDSSCFSSDGSGLSGSGLSGGRGKTPSDEVAPGESGHGGSGSSGSSSSSPIDGPDGPTYGPTYGPSTIGEGCCIAPGNPYGRMEILRPGNPAPPSSSPSLPDATPSDPRLRSPASSASASLLQVLLGRSRHCRPDHPPSTIYLPPRQIYTPKFNRDRKEHKMCHDYCDCDDGGDASRRGAHHLSLRRSPCAESEARRRRLRMMVASLRAKASSLRSQHWDILASLKNLDEEARCKCLELLRSLAACGGDATQQPFVDAVERLEPLRARRMKLIRELEETERALEAKRYGLEELCLAHCPSPPPSHQGCRPKSDAQHCLGLKSNAQCPLQHPPRCPSPLRLPSASASASEASRLEGRWFAPTKSDLQCSLQHPPQRPSPFSGLPLPSMSTSASAASRLEGRWFALTKPTYPACLGNNDAGDPMYTLGRMSFEMFRPGDLVVSIDAVFNIIGRVKSGADDGRCAVPAALREEVCGAPDGMGSGWPMTYQ